MIYGSFTGRSHKFNKIHQILYVELNYVSLIWGVIRCLMIWFRSIVHWLQSDSHLFHLHIWYTGDLQVNYYGINFRYFPCMLIYITIWCWSPILTKLGPYHSHRCIVSCCKFGFNRWSDQRILAFETNIGIKAITLYSVTQYFIFIFFWVCVIESVQ